MLSVLRRAGFKAAQEVTARADGRAICPRSHRLGALFFMPGLLPWSREADTTTAGTQSEPSPESPKALGYVNSDFIQLFDAIVSQKVIDVQVAKDLPGTLSGVWGMTDVNSELAEPVA